MEQLIAQLRIILANTVVLYWKSHAIHFNVVGADFPQYHAFFNTVYDDLQDAIDPVGEHIRMVGGRVPTALPALMEITSITGEVGEDADFEAMITDFQAANDSIITTLREGISVADEAGEPAVSNFLQDRLGAHQKLAWMVRSILE
jgi:starvation-inducible DNA-binding protein